MPRRDVKERRAYGRAYMRKQRENPEKKEEMLAKQRDWRKRNMNGDRNRDRQYRCRYGISLKEYNEILEDQKGTCVLCDATTAYKQKGKSLHVDHCHDSNKVRGLLCSACNTTLGRIEHMGGVSWLKRVAKYIR